MDAIRVLLAKDRDDVITARLVERLAASTRFVLADGGAWSARELEGHLAERRPLDAFLVVLICSTARNEVLSRELLAQHPDLVVVRIDIDAAVAGTEAINVDLVQHLRLDTRQLGFDRLLRAMQHLVEHHGAGDKDRMAHFLVLGDPASIDGGGVRFFEVRRSVDASTPNRRLAPQALRWVNAVIGAYLARYPIGEGGQNPFYMSRQRALDLLAELHAEVDGRVAPNGRGDPVAEASRALLRFLNDAAHDADPLVRLRRRLGMTLEDLQVLLLCLAPDVGLGYQLIYSHIQDDMTRRFATAGLVDALLSGHATPNAAASICTLLSWRLLATQMAVWPGADEPLRPDPALLQWILVGGDALLEDPAVRASTREQQWIGRELVSEEGDRVDQAYLQQRLLGADAQSYWTVLTGPDLEGWRALLEAVAISARTGLVRVSLPSFAALEAHAREDAAIRISRAARLMSMPTVIDCPGDVVDPAALSPLVDAHTDQGGACVLVVGDSRVAASLLPRGCWRVRSRPTPGLASRAHHFDIVFQTLGIPSRPAEPGTGLAERMAAAYPLDIQELAAATALAISQVSSTATVEERTSALSDACRRIVAPDVLRIARRLEPTYTLDDVIVPKDRKEQLREIVTNVEHARRVFEDWGFGPSLPYGRGVAALFAGPSGTGKTMAAQAIARRLNVDVYAVDLSRVSSKYVGETEKNLDLAFSDAERSGSVLLFDEADALFGKRSHGESQGANEYYQNQTIAFLLQRTEAFSGLAILTTNHRQGLDTAFLRRLRFIVDFPKPDAQARQEIWKRCIPSSAPKGDDIDWQLLAWFDLSGGVIRQISVRAAFLAAQEGADEICMKHLRAALKAELTKLGMQTAERDLAEYDRLNPEKLQAA
jgi:ATP-dependent 26S proteasome regulatory subunit